jgi:hypothetical protein
MLRDVNRTGASTPSSGFGLNIVGGGSDGVRPRGVAEPGTLAILGLGLAGLAWRRREHRPAAGD